MPMTAEEIATLESVARTLRTLGSDGANRAADRLCAAAILYAEGQTQAAEICLSAYHTMIERSAS